LLRDYKECMSRNVGYDIKRLLDLITMRSDYVRLPESYDTGLAYFTNLYAYDAFEGQKLLIYYEDMMLYPQ